MELNAEVNKIFGQEMAKLFAATIDEKELSQKAQQVWTQMNKSESSYGYRSDSQIETYIQNQILARLYEKIKKLLEEPINEETLEAKAREMVEKARQIGEEIIIRDMAQHMANNALSVYSRDERIIQEILSQLHMRQDKQRLY